MLADAEQWRRLFDTGVTSDSPEAQRLAAQIMDKNIKAKAAKAQVPQDAEEQAAMPLSDTLGVVRSALCGDPRFADPCGAALYRQQGVRRLRQRGHSHSRSASCAAA